MFNMVLNTIDELKKIETFLFAIESEEQFDISGSIYVLETKELYNYRTYFSNGKYYLGA